MIVVLIRIRTSTYHSNCCGEECLSHQVIANFSQVILWLTLDSTYHYLQTTENNNFSFGSTETNAAEIPSYVPCIFRLSHSVSSSN
ncbi:hypothetical protein AB6A40_006970 [Gnathostoma spinigerum]|uniref:Uncharacterized protein n=1 Tax=Gnathostoma spinigerum TaxID=75299 RepID=A0ABD6ES29_9BILA